MNLYRYAFALCVSCLLAGSTQAQSMPIENIEQFESQVKQAVEELQYCFSNVTNVSMRNDIRSKNLKHLLRLFIGDGEAFDYTEDGSNKLVSCPGVKINISSAKFKNSKAQLLKRFLYRIYNPDTGLSNMSYSNISIGAANVVRIDDAQEVGDHYECTAYFTQKYVGFRDGRTIYTDRTITKIRCYLKKNPIVKITTGEQINAVKFGDIYVVSN